MDGEAQAWPLLHSDPDGTFWIPVNANNIETAFRHASTSYDRLLHKRFYSLAIHHLRDHHPPVDDLGTRLNNLSSVLEEASALRHCSPIRRESGRSLPDIVDQVITEASFFFGPETPKPGEAEDDCRFICIFCHNVRTRTGDLKFHLRKKHKFEDWEIEETISKDATHRLRVFGPYSYEDVLLNHWDIPAWKPRGLGSLQLTDANVSVGPSNKRRHRREPADTDLQEDVEHSVGGSTSSKRRLGESLRGVGAQFPREDSDG